MGNDWDGQEPRPELVEGTPIDRVEPVEPTISMKNTGEPECTFCLEKEGILVMLDGELICLACLDNDDSGYVGQLDMSWLE